MAAPKLRFKEFDGDWSSIAIGNLLKIKSGLGFKAEEYTTEEAIRLLQIENVGYGAVKWTHNVKYVPHDYLSIHSELVLKEDDIVLALNRPVTNDQLKIAKLTKDDGPSILYQRVGKLEFTKNEIDHNFIFQIFQKEVKSYVLNSSIGSDQPFISTTDLYKHKITLPAQKEQTKIASFLSAVDEKISQLTQKHALLSQYKQGMMQKLFSQQIRFKADDGSEFEEWEEKQLGEIIKFVNGKGHENDVDSDGSYTLINSKFLSTNGSVAKKVNKCNQKVMNDSLVMVMSDVPNGKALAKVMYILDGSNFALNQRIGMFIFHKDHYPKFFQYQLNRHQYYLAFDSGVGQTNLKKEDVLNCPILVPCIEEQTKIANFLSSIDQKIEVVAQQIEQAKQWKKGLLQQMFV